MATAKKRTGRPPGSKNKTNEIKEKVQQMLGIRTSKYVKRKEEEVSRLKLISGIKLDRDALALCRLHAQRRNIPFSVLVADVFSLWLILSTDINQELYSIARNEKGFRMPIVPERYAGYLDSLGFDSITADTTVSVNTPDMQEKVKPIEPPIATEVVSPNALPLDFDIERFIYEKMSKVLNESFVDGGKIYPPKKTTTPAPTPTPTPTPVPTPEKIYDVLVLDDLKDDEKDIDDFNRQVEEAYSRMSGTPKPHIMDDPDIDRSKVGSVGYSSGLGVFNEEEHNKRINPKTVGIGNAAQQLIDKGAIENPANGYTEAFHKPSVESPQAPQNKYRPAHGQEGLE